VLCYCGVALPKLIDALGRACGGTRTEGSMTRSGAFGPYRVEQAAFIKAITAQTNLSLFDVDVTRMQGQFAGLEAKGIEDIVNAILVAGLFYLEVDAATEARSDVDARARRRWRRVFVADLKGSLPARPSWLGLAVA
jgi:hypothetical protein